MHPSIQKILGLPIIARLFRSRHLLFTLDKKGIVGWVFGLEDHTEQHLAAKILNRNIRDFYMLDEKKTIDSQANKFVELSDPEAIQKSTVSGTLYESRNTLENLVGTLEFYTDIPLSVLYLARLDRNQYMGLMLPRARVLYYFANYLKHYPLVLIDEDNHLCGYNQALINCFYQYRERPDSLMGKDVRKILSMEPGQAIAQQLAQVSDYHQVAWQLFISRDFTYLKRGEGLECSLPESVEYSAEGLRWHGKESLDDNLITLLSEINIQGFDVKVEFEFNSNKGVPPGCIIGSARYDRNSLFPDFRGYHFGFQENGKEVFIKKYGEPIGIRKNPVNTGKWATIQIVKHGKGLFFNIDGKTVLSYYDDSPPAPSGPFVSLFLRKGSEVLIRHIRIFLKEKLAISERTEAEVSLLNKTENTYLIHQIVAGITTRNRKMVRAFQLEDVSSFKQNIKRLEREKTREREEKEKLKVLLDQKTHGDESFVGKSKPIFEIKDKARLIAETRTTVLITGETGTGKEVLARYIHENSAFKNGPFIRVDCAALPPTLIESELFGHEKGAFSGAIAKKKGKFELARKGTLFLDEIGNISPEVQTKLLGFLNDFIIQPIGSERSVKLDLRVICATNVDLNGLVKEGRFREDLYFRLNVVKFTLPPLRDRPDDIPDLSIHYLKKYNQEFSKTVKSISSNAFQTLYSHAWPGNVRELESVIQKAVLFTNKDIIEEDAIELEAGVRKASVTGSATKHKINTRKLTKEDIEGLIQDYNGNLNQVAKVTGIARKTLYNKIEKFGIHVDTLRQ